MTGHRCKMSLRVSHPLRSTSAQAWPNSARVYPVFGPRPATRNVPKTDSADVRLTGGAGAGADDCGGATTSEVGMAGGVVGSCSAAVVITGCGALTGVGAPHPARSTPTPSATPICPRFTACPRSSSSYWAQNGLRIVHLARNQSAHRGYIPTGIKGIFFTLCGFPLIWAVGHQ